jgi:hypothetical protein
VTGRAELVRRQSVLDGYSGGLDMRRILTAVAAIALVAGAAHAQGNSGGGGQGRGQGGGGGPAAQGSGGKPDRAGGSQRGGGMQAIAGPGGGSSNQDRGSADRGPVAGNADRANADRGQGGGRDGQAAGAPREGGGSKDRGNAGRADRADNRNANRATVADRGRANGGIVVDRGRDIDVVRISNFASAPGRGLIAGCPPGLAKKNPPCVPPGQARDHFFGYDDPRFWGLRLGDGRYWYDDGYLFRLGPDGRIGGFIPLLGGALAIGNVWPSFYQPVALPTYYESYYGLGPYGGYRYADNVIYRVDPETAAITSVAALLTGDDFVVGRPMPVGYDVYNVPYSYRAQYYDRPDALYRYSDGYVYQVDPETRLIAAAIELLAT